MLLFLKVNAKKNRRELDSYVVDEVQMTLDGMYDFELQAEYLRSQIAKHPTNLEIKLMYIQLLEKAGVVTNIDIKFEDVTLHAFNVERILPLCKFYYLQGKKRYCWACLAYAKKNFPTHVPTLLANADLTIKLGKTDQTAVDHIVSSLNGALTHGADDPKVITEALMGFETIHHVGRCLEIGRAFVDAHPRPVGDQVYPYGPYIQCLQSLGDMALVMPTIDTLVLATHHDASQVLGYLSMYPPAGMRLPQVSGMLLKKHTQLISHYTCAQIAKHIRDPGPRHWVQALHKSAGKYARESRPSASMPLRVGYIAGDFRMFHPVLQLVSGLLMSHDPAKVTVFAYNDNDDSPEPAHFPAMRLKAHFKARAADGWVWRTTHDLSHEEAVQIYLRDKLDILIDLSAFFNSGVDIARLCIRAAPVVATYLGFSATTGHPHVDFYIADTHTIPPEREGHFTEHVARLPAPFGAFSLLPLPNTPEPAASAPMLSRGYVTFGSLNDIIKTSPLYISLVASVLLAVPNSRYKISCKQCLQGYLQQHYNAQFQRYGVDPSRVEYLGPSAPVDPTVNFLTKYHGIDIVLDPTPYTGTRVWVGLSLWMFGCVCSVQVPVVRHRHC